MTALKKNAFIAGGSALFFSLLYLTGIFVFPESRIFDFFLRFRPDRNRLDQIVFLDIDDQAIADIGVFPWPRSVMADSLLRLKEYGVKAAIFDIEYIDNSPSGVDEIYLRQGLRSDFDQSFMNIDSSISELFYALRMNQISLRDAFEYAEDLSEIIGEEQENLLNRTLNLVRNNDEYLAQASAVFGNTWATLNLQTQELSGEQAERRPYTEERFSYPVEELPGAMGGTSVDILSAIPSFMEAAKGAGFTNVEIDPDGVRRRIFLARKVKDHWYLQLAFSPLANMLGSPPLILGKNKLTMKGAVMPDGRVKDIVVPLDGIGAMLLDWPKSDYSGSYVHLSYANFSILERREQRIYSWCSNLAVLGYWNQLAHDPVINNARTVLAEILETYNTAEEFRRNALRETSEEYFAACLEYMEEYRSLAREFIDSDAADVLVQQLRTAIERQPADAGAFMRDIEYIENNVRNMKMDIDEVLEIRALLDKTIKGKICIIGRVDTGTTDIGVNPFFGEYVNVGTHGVILDTILSESFLVQLNYIWSILISLIFVPLLMIVIGRLKPGLRALLGFFAAFIILIVSLCLFIFRGIFFGPLGPVIAMIAAVIIRETISYVTTEKERSFIHKALSTYTSEAVAQEIINNPTLFQLGGLKRRMSAIFTDVRGFSGIAERLDPEELVRLLNRYLSIMSDVALKEQGTIDKYEGDAIIAFFGAPKPLADHAIRACHSAVLMKRVEKELNKALMEEKLTPVPLLTRIGINTGEMVVGNMGTDNKMNYTIMGNAVNLAARLEGVNKKYGTWILASDETIKETNGLFLTRRLDMVRVVGINEPVLLHEVLDIKEKASPEQIAMVDIFHEAMDLFVKKDWPAAEKAFNRVLDQNPGDAASKNYILRCIDFQNNPPEADWDGIFNLTEK